MTMTLHSRYTSSVGILLLVLLLAASRIEAFAAVPTTVLQSSSSKCCTRQRYRRHRQDAAAVSSKHRMIFDEFSADDDDNNNSDRRNFLLQTSTIIPLFAAAAAVAGIAPLPAVAAAEKVIELPTRETVTQTFDSIRYELRDANGGVAYMQSKIDEQDFEGLLEFTKTYDLELRKKRMGLAKKLMVVLPKDNNNNDNNNTIKQLKETATTYANAVTFDLIGINRSSRKGQESVESANKYLQELREDIGRFLTLESAIPVLQ